MILLRKAAEDPALTGSYRYEAPLGRKSVEFDYTVERVWQWPVEPLLHGGLGTLPLAPIADVTVDDLPRIVHQMEHRLDETTSSMRADLWVSTAVLMGLRYPAPFVSHLLQGVTAMKESSVYQAILDEGRE